MKRTRADRNLRIVLAVVAPLALLAAEESPRPAVVDGARIQAADTEPGSWLAHGRTYSEQRYSPLSQIGRGNVGELGLAWAYRTETTRGLEATPIVADGVLYATGSWSVVYALDAATGRELWVYDPEVPRAKGRNACCDVVNRGVALWRGRVYVGTIDGRLIALDAATGEVLWSKQTTDPAKPYTITGAPRVVKDNVIIGNGGAEFGVRGYFSAYDAATGEMAWRFYTVPAGPSAPFEHPELEVAARTWSPDSLFETGLGGTVWDSMAYDPVLDLLYVGVGNSSVYDRERRSPGGGDNLFLASILAVRPETGRLVWHYQTTPGEYWDYTATQHMILADLELGGRMRKLLLQAPKNGFFYVLDRETGELLSAEKYSTVTWATHVDLETGRPVERQEAHWSKAAATVSPGVAGAHNWHPMSFSPRTGLVYIPSTDFAYVFEPDPAFVFSPGGTFNTAEDWGAVAETMEGYEDALRFCSPTHLNAWDPVRQQQAWRVEHRSQVPGGVLSTAGDIVFQGRGSGWFSAYDAFTGDKLWETETGVGVMAPAISYAIGEEQYIAVLAGVGGSHGLHRDPLRVVNDGRILAWKLGGRAKMPTFEAVREKPIEAPRLQLTEAKVSRGRDLYHRHCARCHGIATRNAGVIPDLKKSSRKVHETWDAIVRGGALSGAGMASFADVVDEEDAQAIQGYVVSRALHEPTFVQRAAKWLSQYACVPASLAAD